MLATRTGSIRNLRYSVYTSHHPSAIKHHQDLRVRTWPSRGHAAPPSPRNARARSGAACQPSDEESQRIAPGFWLRSGWGGWRGSWASPLLDALGWAGARLLRPGFCSAELSTLVAYCCHVEPHETSRERLPEPDAQSDERCCSGSHGLRGPVKWRTRPPGSVSEMSARTGAYRAPIGSRRCNCFHVAFQWENSSCEYSLRGTGAWDARGMKGHTRAARRSGRALTSRLGRTGSTGDGAACGTCGRRARRAPSARAVWPREASSLSSGASAALASRARTAASSARCGR